MTMMTGKDLGGSGRKNMSQTAQLSPLTLPQPPTARASLFCKRDVMLCLSPQVRWRLWPFFFPKNGYTDKDKNLLNVRRWVALSSTASVQMWNRL